VINHKTCSWKKSNARCRCGIKFSEKESTKYLIRKVLSIGMNITDKLPTIIMLSRAN
jgi:hypothetical protein